MQWFSTGLKVDEAHNNYLKSSDYYIALNECTQILGKKKCFNAAMLSHWHSLYSEYSPN